jgi:hypothetical protein
MTRLFRIALIALVFFAAATGYVSRAALERPESQPVFGAPGGRLSVAAAAPKTASCTSTADVAAATAVVYLPCNNRYVPIYDGTRLKAYDFTQSISDSVGLVLLLGSSWTGSTLYDVFVTLQGGVPVLCTVPWSNSTPGTSTRATALAAYDVYQTNTSPIAECRITNDKTIAVGASQGTYLGLFYTNAAGGQVDLKFGTMGAGGGPACICVWNMYNQIDGAPVVQESTSSWSVREPSKYEPLNAKAKNGGLGNRITLISGNATSPIDASYSIIIDAASAGNIAQFGVALNQTTALATKCPPVVVSQGGGNSSGQRCLIYPAVGLNFLQAIQWATSTDTAQIAFRSSSPSAEALSGRYRW